MAFRESQKEMNIALSSSSTRAVSVERAMAIFSFLFMVTNIVPKQNTAGEGSRLFAEQRSFLLGK